MEVIERARRHEITAEVVRVEKQDYGHDRVTLSLSEGLSKAEVGPRQSIHLIVPKGQFALRDGFILYFCEPKDVVVKATYLQQFNINVIPESFPA